VPQDIADEGGSNDKAQQLEGAAACIPFSTPIEILVIPLSWKPRIGDAEILEKADSCSPLTFLA
jgi:hypothetical protein